MNKVILFIFTFSIVVLSAALLVIYRNSNSIFPKSEKDKQRVNVSAQNTDEPTPTAFFAVIPSSPFPTRPPTNTPAAPYESSNPYIAQSSTYDSPDGTRSLTLKMTKENEENVFEAFTHDKSAQKNIVIFSNMKSQARGFVIPYNTWSPDNNYFYLKDVSDGYNSVYLVFDANNNIASAQAIDIKKLFDETLAENYFLEDVTGWAAPYLLIVNTKDRTGAEGPSYWFDITTKSFILLSTRFR